MCTEAASTLDTGITANSQRVCFKVRNTPRCRAAEEKEEGQQGGDTS